jgi:hypothetical protein
MHRETLSSLDLAWTAGRREQAEWDAGPGYAFDKSAFSQAVRERIDFRNAWI